MSTTLAPPHVAPPPVEGIIVGIFGELCLFVGIIYTFGALLEKPRKNTTLEKDFVKAFKEIGGVILIGGGAFAGIALFIGVAKNFPLHFAALFILLIIAYLFLTLFTSLLKPLITLIYHMLGFIYEQTQPKTTVSKLFTAIFSIIFGLFSLMVLFSISGMLLPFFLNPVGFILAIVVLIVFMLLGTIIAGIFRAVFRRRIAGQ